MLVRFEALWGDGMDDTPELILIGALTQTLLGTEIEPVLRAVAGFNQRPPELRLLGESAERAAAIKARLDRLAADVAHRTAYAGLLTEVWAAADAAWRRDGIKQVAQACNEWQRKLSSGIPIEHLVAPRHPLARMAEAADLVARVDGLVVSPLYFCMSGGEVIDVGLFLHVAVAASDLHPIRKERDAALVADRMRVLAERTRAHIFIQLLSAPASVIELAESLHLSQATVSDHLAVLRNAGLLEGRKRGAKTIYSSSAKRVQRLLDDVRGTLAVWE
jgi:DNA-binding transcriptional ArsR family regulator